MSKVKVGTRYKRAPEGDLAFIKALYSDYNKT